MYDNDLSFTDRVGNTFKEWGNRGLYTTDYIAQTAGTALTDFFESQLNEEYNSLINRRMDLAAQLNRITFGYDEDPYGKRYAALEKEMEQLNRYIDENYREKMDTTTDAYHAMERAQKYEDKAVEGYSPELADAYGWITGTAGAVATLPLNMFVPGATLAIETADNAVRKMHEINSSGGTAGQALGRGVTAAGIMFAAKKAPIKELAKFSNSNIGRLALKEELVKHGLKMSQNVLEYAANYMADLSYHNPNAQFTLSELAGEIAEDYLKEIILDY